MVEHGSVAGHSVLTLNITLTVAVGRTFSCCLFDVRGFTLTSSQDVSTITPRADLIVKL